MKFAIPASPDIFGVVGPHYAARNFGNTLCQKFRQQIQKLDFFWRKNGKNWHFRLFILGGKGVRPKIFFSTLY